MFHNVLVPLDGSWYAEAALPEAARIADASGGMLNLVMVHQPVASLSGVEGLVASPEIELEWLAKDQNYLAGTAAGLSARKGVTVEYRGTDGTPGPEICEEATRLGADLIVMATHGRGGFRRRWLGGVADYVVRHLAVPVLLVHPDQTAVTRKATPARRILVALDQSPDSEAILEPAIALATVTGSSLTIVHVCEVLPDASIAAMPGAALPAAELMEFARSTAQERLDHVVARARRPGLHVEARVVVGTGAASSLLEMLESARYDTIAMTTHGRGGISRVVLGSVADKVIRGTQKPVLVVRPGPHFITR